MWSPHECTAIWVYQEFMTGLAFATISVRLTLSHYDTNRHGSTIKSYAEILTDLSRCGATDAVVVEAKEETCNLRPGSLAPWDYSRTFHDLPLWCGGEYYKLSLQRYIIDGNEVSIRSAMRRWWTGNQLRGITCRVGTTSRVVARIERNTSETRRER